MMKLLYSIIALLALQPVWAADAPTSGYPHVVISTSMGEIELELRPDKAPLSVANFLQYVDQGYYDQTIFHRVISDFMIQGGGFTADLVQKTTAAPIKNEADNGLTNRRGTVAMARTNAVNSATSQFFINTQDNDFLNNGARDFGYAVFARVVRGMEVADQISRTPTRTTQGMQNLPVTPVLILHVTRVEPSKTEVKK